MKKTFSLFALLCTTGCAAAAGASIQQCAGSASGHSDALFPFLYTVLGIAVGAAGNHWLSLSRDRRKEFNEVSDPIRTALKSERRSVNVNYSHLDSDAVSVLADMIGGRKGARLDAAVQAYKQARQQNIVADTFGQSSYTQTAHVEAAIDGILKHLKRR